MEEPVRAALQGQIPTSPRRRILVVDDEPDLRQINTAVLTNSGYHVDAAEDGAAAWDALQRNNYDLLVTDNNMPRMSGVDLLKKLHGACMALPVIMATGTVPQYEFVRHPWIQPSATLLKPHTNADLVATVRKVLHANDCAPEPEAPLHQTGRVSPWPTAGSSDDYLFRGSPQAMGSSPQLLFRGGGPGSGNHPNCQPWAKD